MKSTLMKSLCALALVAAPVMSLQAQELKIGYVNLERVTRESNFAKVAQTKLEAEFSRREKDIKDAEGMIAMCREIGVHEDAADEVFRKAIARLFKEEKNAIEVMKWRDIFDALETATDRAEDVANILEGIVLEHA